MIIKYFTINTKSSRALTRLRSKNIYIYPLDVLRAGDDVELCTEAEAGVHQVACAVWGRMQRRRQPWL